MARRMSNRDRIDRLREEAHLADAERAAKQKAASKAGTGPSARARATGEPGRMFAVWAIKDGMGEVVATYPYSRKADAEREAVRLKQVNRKTYIVAPHKIPADD
ncbi:MAG: hypothetical protein ACYS0E_07195 [Planctomycetota bacterium]